jgi:hypothetical protein
MRIRKLEAYGGTGKIPIWCDDDTDMPATIDEMIAKGELQKSDRPRFIHWARMQAKSDHHERALGILT